MGNFINITGERFGNLTVLKKSDKSDKTGKTHWDCLCDCGKTVSVVGGNLRNGHTKSCGCLRHNAAPNFEDISGVRFGKLTVVGRTENNKFNQAVWRCLCDCGNYAEITAGHLRDGHTQSCGCLVREACGQSFTTHGLSKTKLYRTWAKMVERCTNPNAKGYRNYGGRGISVSDEFRHDFAAFYNHMMECGYADDLSIDRIDVNGNYERGNIRWIPLSMQQKNVRKNRVIEIDGVKKILSDWAVEFGVSTSLINARLKLGWSERDAITIPKGQRGNRFSSHTNK